MNIKPLWQRNPKWGKTKLGFSNLEIEDYGCTLTCLTMLINYIDKADYTPEYVNTKLRAVKAFSGALIIWARVPLAFPSIRFAGRGYNYSNLIVSNYVYLKRLPVMVEVNAEAIGGLYHWVLFIGERKIIDPWTGTIRSTSTYPTTGYSLYQKK